MRKAADLYALTQSRPPLTLNKALQNILESNTVKRVHSFYFSADANRSADRALLTLCLEVTFTE